MSRVVKVCVTAQDIADAWQEREESRTPAPASEHCPVARAMARVLGFKVSCGYNNAYRGYRGQLLGALPHEAQDLIRRYDNFVQCRPVEFEVEVEDGAAG